MFFLQKEVAKNIPLRRERKNCKKEVPRLRVCVSRHLTGAGGSYPVKLPKGSYFLDKLKKRITAIGQKYSAFFINTLCSLSLSSLGFLDFWENFLLARSDKAKRNPENTTTLDSFWETSNV